MLTWGRGTLQLLLHFWGILSKLIAFIIKRKSHVQRLSNPISKCYHQTEQLKNASGNPNHPDSCCLSSTCCDSFPVGTGCKSSTSLSSLARSSRTSSSRCNSVSFFRCSDRERVFMTSLVRTNLSRAVSFRTSLLGRLAVDGELADPDVNCRLVGTLPISFAIRKCMCGGGWGEGNYVDTDWEVVGPEVEVVVSVSGWGCPSIPESCRRVIVPD